jgi:8-oxo-dGTP pyrophosphatase MutT (NUDIX family)
MRERVRQVLSLRPKKRLSGYGLNEAAVLVPIYDRRGEYHLLFTKRSQLVPYHKGQVSFPGGARSEADVSLKDTALRESWEEIGLRAKDVDIVGELDDTPTTTSNFSISPFVAFIPYPYQFTVNRAEIDEIFGVPISFLLSGAGRREESYEIGDQLVTGYIYEFEGRIIWGATARIVQQFLEVWQQASGAR